MFCISPGKFARISISNATKKHTQSIRSDPPPRFPSRVVSQFDQKFLDFRLPKIHVRTFSRCQKRVGPFFRGHWMSLAALLNPLFSLNLRLVVFLVQKSEVDTSSQKQWTCTWLNLVSTKWSMFQEFSMIFVCWQSIFGGHCHPNKIPTSHPSRFLYLAGTKSLYKKVASSIDL